MDISVNTQTEAITKTDFVPFVEVERSAPACLNEDGAFEDVCVYNVPTEVLFCEDKECATPVA